MGQYSASEKAWYARNAEYKRESSARWRKTNAEQERTRNAAYNATHREERRAYNKQYYERNADAIKARSRAWTQVNPDRNRAKVAAYYARSCSQFVEHVDPRVVWEMHGGCCGICNAFVDAATFEVDHVVPISKGGMHGYVNVQPAHPHCNRRKGNRV